MKNMFLIAIALCSTAAFARTDTTNLTCAGATALVADAGSVVLSTGKPYLYDKFVANQSFCANSQRAVSAFVETSDSNSCRIGYVCQENDRGGNSISKKYPSSITVCKEGKFGTARETDYYPARANKDKVENITVVCQAGKWVPANDRSWKATKTVGGLKCKDGATYYYPTPDKISNPGPFDQKFVCKAGKWYKAK